MVIPADASSKKHPCSSHRSVFPLTLLKYKVSLGSKVSPFVKIGLKSCSKYFVKKLPVLAKVSRRIETMLEIYYYASLIQSE